MRRVYKVLYVKDPESKQRGPYKIVAIFDMSSAQKLGVDDADYSQIDALVALLKSDNEVQSEEYQSLGEISAVLGATS